MKKIVAIGGGEIGHAGLPTETTSIDKEIIRLSGKNNPKLLFIPTASGDSEGYAETAKNYFGQRLGCLVEILYLIKPSKRPSKKEIRSKILSSDIIYVGGGNALRMMKLWRKLGVDIFLKEAHEKEIVLSGLSAGSICWFKYGNSKSKKVPDKNNFTNIKIKGLGLIDALHCPHYDKEEAREKSLKIMMKRTKEVAIALDDCCALIVIDGKYKIISSKNGKNAYQIYWEKNVYNKKIIKERKKLSFLSQITEKRG